jgi:phosphoacetylglucosamine mutase
MERQHSASAAFLHFFKKKIVIVMQCTHRYLAGALGIPVSCAKTGVKHLHHEALVYDIGVYFEANGHGTVIFSDSAKAQISAATPSTDREIRALKQLRHMIDLVNEVA